MSIPLLLRRLGPAALVVAVASLFWVIPASLRVMATNSNNVADWLPDSFQATQDLTWFIGHFGSDEILVISWPGCTLEDERLPQLAAALQDYRYGSTPEGATPFRQILTGPQVIEQLTSEPARLSREQAIERMTLWLVGPAGTDGPDGQTSCAVALLSDAGLANRHWPIEVVYETAESVCGIARADLKLGGSTFDSVAIDWATSIQNMVPMVVASLLISVGIAWWSLRSWLLTALVFASATYSLGLSLAIMDVTGQRMNSMLILVPALVYVLAISASIHLANYFREAARQTTPDLAAARTLMLGWSPCLLASVTTAVGLGSLAVSQLVPIRQFAIYSATGVLVATAVLLLLFPAALHLFSRPLVRSMTRIRSPRPRQTGRPARRFESRLARCVLASHRPLVLFGIASLLLAGYGASRVRSSFDLQSLFRPQSYIVSNYAWLERELGPLIPVEVVVRFDRECPLSWLDRLNLVRKINRRVGKLDHVGGIISPATFLPDPPQGSGARMSAARSVFNRRVPQYQQQLRDVGYWAESEDEQLWRITARVEALANVDFGDFLGQLRHVVGTTLDGENHIAFTDCGGVPLVHSAQRAILRDLLKSFLTAMLLITVAVALILRSALGGLLMMLPNIFPVLLVFGTMGYLGVNVDIGGMMTASVALGIAVDDTLHFLTWFQRARVAGRSRRVAVMSAYRRCASAMMQTTAVCSLGLLAFASSEFVPVARFSWLMAAALLAALLGDLILLPAILASRLGRVFR